jgi:lysophospholipase L1-like esterase
MQLRWLRRTRRLAGLAVVLALPIAGAGPVAPPIAAASPSQTGPNWVGSWMAAPSDASSQPLSNQTVRMVISPHLDGKWVRLELTNRFGDAPVTLSHVTVAKDGGGASIVPSSLSTVTFGGSASVTMPAGADTLSDPLHERVSEDQKLSVSVAVSGTVANPTEHSLTREINYWTSSGSGDHTADASGAAFAPSATGRSSGWYFLEGLDVKAQGRTSSVVAFGDSLTDGFVSSSFGVEDFATLGLEERYPDFLQRRIDAAHLPLSVLNAGIGGNRVLADGFFPIHGPSALHRLEADAIDQPGVRTVILFEGINDIGLTPGLTAQQLIDGYKQLIARLHAAGLHVLLGTIAPAGGFAVPTYGADQIRLPVNAWIRSQGLSDGVIDFDAAIRDPSNPSRILPAYDDGDHLHYSAAGYEALADAVPLGQL